MNKAICALAALVVLAVPTSGVFAQYDLQSTNIGDVYDNVRDAKIKLEIARDPDAVGSGTPYFALDGVIISAVLSAGIFGGVSAMFFIRGQKGRYAAQGRD